MIKSLNPSSIFVRQFKKITKNNSHLKEKVIETLEILRIDPFNFSLNTHKVNARVGGIRWSSRVTGDIRIIWDFNEKVIKVIDLLDIGTHSGSKKVYK